MAVCFAVQASSRAFATQDEFFKIINNSKKNTFMPLDSNDFRLHFLRMKQNKTSHKEVIITPTLFAVYNTEQKKYLNLSVTEYNNIRPKNKYSYKQDKTFSKSMLGVYCDENKINCELKKFIFGMDMIVNNTMNNNPINVLLDVNMSENNEETYNDIVDYCLSHVNKDKMNYIWDFLQKNDTFNINTKSLVNLIKKFTDKNNLNLIDILMEKNIDDILIKIKQNKQLYKHLKLLYLYHETVKIEWFCNNTCDNIYVIFNALKKYNYVL